MTLPYAYTPQIWPPLLAVFLTLVLAFFSIQRRSVPGVLPFIIGCLLGTLWAAGSVMEYAAGELPAKIFWIKFQVIWQLPSATAITCFVLEYAWPGRWLTRRRLALLSIPPLLFLGLIITDSLYHLMWRSFTSEGSLSPQIGPGYWLAILYSFGLVILNTAVLIWLFIHSPQHRWPAAMMIIGPVGVRVVYVLDKTNLLHSHMPLDVFGLVFSLLMYAIALFGFRIFDPIPLARQTVIEQLRDGMIVVDPQGQVASLNLAAEQILQIPAKMVKGKAVRDLLPVDLGGMLEIPKETEVEFTLVAEQGDNGHTLRYCTLGISQLKDWRGMKAGSLLLLRDVTSHKLADAALNQAREIQRLIYEKSFDGISIYEELPDEDKRILVDCNERYCQMAGRSKEELLAIQDTRLIQHSEHLTEEADREAVMAEQVFRGEFSWIRPDGKENIIEYNAAPIKVGERFYTIGVDRDITESRQTQAQILEQQRALATLKEREQVARELHDDLAQELALINVQAQLVQGLIETGQDKQALEQIQLLAKSARKTQLDVRGQIRQLSFGIAPEEGFVGALDRFLEMFRQIYEIETELIMPEDQLEVSLSPMVEAQLLRIIQEAFTNIRKHACARHVRVSLTRQTGCTEVTVEDDGVGFIPDYLPTPGRTFGLGIMSARAKELNGRVEVISAPGQGTKIVVEIPVDGGKDRIQ